MEPFWQKRAGCGAQPSRLVQPKLSILVLFYDEVQRIYSLATGAIPIHQT